MLFGRRVVNDTVLRAQDQTTSEQSTKTLSKAIENENLEDFKQALAEGEDINAFDEEGTTPLMSIASIYITSNNQPALKEMAKLLIQKRSININVQSKQFISVEQWRFDSITRDMVAELRTTFNTRKDTALHTSCQVGARDIVKILLTHPDVRTDVINCENKGPKDCIARGFENIVRLEFEKAQKGKELLNALSGRNIDRAKRLLNQELNPNCWRRASNGEIETPLSLIIKSCLQGITQDNEEVLTKLLKHKELDFSQTKPIPAIEQNSRLKQIIERAMKERLTDVINRKDLDDVKELVEDNCFINRAIVTDTLRNVNNPIESIKDYLNKKFPASMEQLSANAHNVAPAINDEFIAQELQQLENLRDELERTKTQLRAKEQELSRTVDERTRDTNKILQLERELRQVRQDNQERIRTFTDQVTQLENLRDELERTKTQLRKKEQELNKAVSERTRDTNKISQLERDFGQERLELQAQNQDLKNKNRKLSEASIYNRRQSDYASASFMLSGAFAVGACLTILNLEICISLAVAAFVFLTIGCYCSYKASTVLSDVTSTEFGNVIDLG